MKLRRHEPTLDPSGLIEIAGENWSLIVTKDASGGPWYPEVEEASNENEYRFFAGRLTGRKAGDALPACFTHVRGSAGEWTFGDGDPDGSWMSLKFDRRNDEVSIACDVWAHQRWYYAERKGAWYFSNSLVFLRRVAGRDAAIDERAMPYMLLFGYLPGRITPLTGVSLLLPGESIAVSRGEMRRQWRPRRPMKRNMTGQGTSDISARVWHESAEGILEHLQEAVRNELEGIGEIVHPLSGGMDSRFILGCALDVLPRDRIVTYTFGDPRTLDQTIATGLARKLGVEHVSLAMDRRPVDEVCADGFEQTEGMAYVFPNTPLGPDRRALLKPGTFVLSGYNGDSVFGSRDVDDTDPAHNTSDFLFKSVFEHACGTYVEQALPLLASRQWDELGYESDVRATPGDSLAERYERWRHEIHCVNRVQYHLFVFRNRAFYLTPFVQRKTWEYSLTLPEAVRRHERGYFMAMKLGYPSLYAHPTSRNLGLSSRLRSHTLLRAQKKWRTWMTRLDDKVWKATGRSLYFNSKQLYEHRHALRGPEYHRAVEDCIEDLKRSPAFDAKGLAALHARYRKRLPVPPQILRALFTIRECLRRYG